MVSYVGGSYYCRVGIGTKGVGGVTVIILSTILKVKTIWFQEFIAEVKIIISCFSLLVCQQIPSREIQTREALYFSS